MKLAFCLFNYFPFGGLQRDFLRIAKTCLQRGHEIDVYTAKWEGEKDPNLQVHLLPIKGWQNHTRNLNFSRELQKQLKNKKYDLVVGFNKIPGLDVYYAADTCFLAKNAGRSFWYRFVPRYRQLAQFEKSVFEKNQKTRILLIAEKQQQEFQKFYQTEKDRFHLLPPGISRERMAPSNAAEIRDHLRDEFNLKKNDLLLLMVGSGFKTKGLDRILVGLSSLDEKTKAHTKLFVIGQDHPESFIHQAKKLNISDKVLFLGGRHDVSRFFLAADLLVHPAYNENTGTVLLEALTAGLPVLTTDVCGYAKYIREARAGLVLSSPFHQQAFNDALQSMLLSTTREDWQRNALQFAKEADIYSMSERAVDILESLR